MHIPDGYLSPQTYAPLWVVMGGYWTIAFARIRTTVSRVRLPLIAVGAAFAFVVMMFNVPIPGGTTGHAVGAGLLAIMLGPWAASVAISVALVIQALLFGDGGVTAIAANCLTMAVVAPWTAWLVYRLVAGGSPIASRRRVVAGAAGAYISLNASALVTSVLFGIQPMIAHTASGQPLYAPYPLWVAVPAMMLEHLFLFGLVEAAVTAAAIAWLQRVDVSLLSGSTLARTSDSAPTAPPPGGTRRGRYGLLWVALGILVVLTPLGLWIPTLLKGGSAWGEWTPAQLQRTLGYVPRGLSGLRGVWTSMFPGYTVPGLTGAVGETVGYVVAAIVGVAVVGAIAGGMAWLIGRLVPDPGAAVSTSAVSAPPLAASLGTRAPAPAPVPTDHRAALPAPDPGARRSGDDYVGRTLASLGAKTREAMSAERSAGLPGWLQVADPRAKLAAGLALILAASLVRTHWPLVIIYVLTLGAAVTSRVALGTTLKRVWLVVPLFTGLVLLPAILNIVTPGQPVATLWILGPGAHLGPLSLPAAVTITKQGLSGATLALLRVVASVGVTTTVIATTKWADLLGGLRALKVPAGFVMVTEMAYRYFFLLTGLARDDFLARRSRTITDDDQRRSRRFVAGRATNLFRRSIALAERVNASMVARGWTGEPRAMPKRPFAGVDLALVVSCVVVAASLVMLGGGAA